MSSIWTVRRSATDHKVSGLCGGVAHQWGIDPVLVRVGAALLALSGGIGVVLYVAGWLMIPLEGQTRSQLDETFPQTARWPRELKIALVVLGCVIGAILLASVLPFGFGSALILAAIWYFGYYKNRPHANLNRPPGSDSDPGETTHGSVGSGSGAGSSSESAPTPTMQFFDFGDRSTPFTDAATAWQQRIREHQRATSAPVGVATTPAAPTGRAAQPPTEHDAFLATPDPAGLYTPATEVVSPRPPNRGLSKPARRLRLASVVVLGLTMTGLGIASALGASIGVTTYLAAALLVAGLTLVAAAWLGRARGILPVALLLALATTFSAVGGTGLDRPGVGAHTIAYTTSSSMPAADGWQSGSMTVDLSRLDVAASRAYDVHVDSGRLKIILGPQTRVAVVSSVHDGYLKVEQQKGTWGSELSDTLGYSGPEPEGPVLTVRASVDQGMLEVQR